MKTHMASMTYLVITAYIDIENRWVVGVYLCLRNGILHTTRNDQEFFDFEMELVFIQIESNVCYLIGALNIDLVKYEKQRPTSDF